MLQRSTVIVSDFLSERRVRDETARHNLLGRHVLTLPGLAAHLAGGFQRTAPSTELRGLLQEPPLAELGGLTRTARLPGFARAATRSLISAWLADLDLQEEARKPGAHARWRELAFLEQHLRQNLPPGQLLLPDLVRLAAQNGASAADRLGPVTLDRLQDVPRLYRPLLGAIAARTAVRWLLPPGVDPAWTPADISFESTPAADPRVHVESCADPAHEALEALRWTRRLLSSGVPAADIAIGTTSLATYDENIQELAAAGGLPLFSAHGRSALNIAAGQYAAAFAAALLHGPTQDRIRRLVSCAEQCGDERLGAFPDGWHETLNPDRLLGSLAHWRRELRHLRTGRPNLADLIERLVTDLKGGAARAAELGERWLSGDTLGIWRHALREGPATALETSLERIRTTDAADPATSVIWASAATLTGWPRHHVRLLGLSARSWPRRSSDEDPLLPNRFLGGLRLRERSTARTDTDTLHSLLKSTGSKVVLSRPRRAADGREQVPSPLLPQLGAGAERELLPRDGTPHALTEADRRAARPAELAADPDLQRTRSAFTYAFEPALGEHDGVVRPGHPAIRRALAGTLSATTLRRLLRNPHGFVAEQALGWSAPEPELELLGLDPKDRGSLLHDVLEAALNSLGTTAHPRGRLLEECRSAMTDAASRWEERRPVPPLLAWRALQDELAELAADMLSRAGEAWDGQRSFAEVRFGFEPADTPGDEDLPWPRHVEVRLPGTDLQLRGVIDRFDLDEAGRRIRVIDYKSGKGVRHDGDLDGGKEVQRTIYGLVIRQLLGDDWDIEAGLLYSDTASPVRLNDLSDSSRRLGEAAREALRLLEAGSAVPGPGLSDNFEGTILAHPAVGANWYLKRKETGLSRIRRHLDELLSGTEGEA